MHKRTLPILLALLSTTISVSAQNRCQMFISHLPGNNPIATVPDAGEITQGCAVSSVDPTAADKNTADCKTLATFPVDIKKDITVAKDVSGLAEDIKIFIFNRNLKEGFVKYRAADLNFEDVNQCLTTLDGSLDFEVMFQRCEFDCP